jgi:cullin 1
LLGEKLYRSLADYLHQYLGKLKQRLKSISGQALLDRYLNECAHYTNAAQIINHVFRYLNRHWVKRELDEGKRSIYDVYTLHLVLWHSELFREISHLLVDAVSELVDKHRKGDIMEAGKSKAFIEFIISLEPDGADLSGSIRDVFRDLLETPWRIALKASDYSDLPVFLYKRPVTATAHIRGLTRTEMEERLILHSGFKQPFTNGDRDTGTVKLISNDLVITEIGK